MKNTAVPDGKRVTNDVTVQEFNNTSTSIGGTAEGLRRSLKELEDDIKKDEEGKKVVMPHGTINAVQMRVDHVSHLAYVLSV